MRALTSDLGPHESMSPSPITRRILGWTHWLTELPSGSETQAIWSDIPTALLRAELERRQNGSGKPACGSGRTRGTYNTSLHVGALILILVLSTAGKSLPPFYFPLQKVQRWLLGAGSMLLSHHSATISPPPCSSPPPLPLPPFRHRRAHRHSLRTPPAHSLCFAHGPLSSIFLEQDIPSHGRVDRYGVHAGSCGYWDVLRNTGRRPHAR